jgi:glucoamylase
MALTAEIDRAGSNQFVMALAFRSDEVTDVTPGTPNKPLTAVSEALA